MKKITRKTIIFLKHLLPVTWYRKLSQRQKLYVMTGVCGLLLIIIPSAIYTLTNMEKAEAAWFNGSWGYRQTVNISSSTSLTDYQVAVTLDTATLITNGKMQLNCNDIRITDINGKLLPYWIEEGSASCNNAATKIWTKIPSIHTTGNTIYIYYGNSSATSVQDGNKVFEFFDDFNKSPIDNSKWQDTTGTNVIHSSFGGRSSVLDSYNDDNDIRFFSKSYVSPASYVIEADYATTHDGGIFFDVQDANNGNLIGLRDEEQGNSTQQFYWYRRTSGNWFALSTASSNPTVADSTFYRYKILKNGSSFSLYQDENLFMNASNTTYTNGGRVGIRGSGGSRSYVDFIFVRKYATTEPTIGSPAIEEQAPGPVAYWSFDEGYGTTTYDSTANKNNGTITGATWQSEDQCISGKCLYFDGDDDYVSSSDFSWTDSDYAISLWFKSNNFNTEQGIIGKNSYEYSLGVNTSGLLQFYHWNDGGTSIINLNTTISSNTWYHVVITKSSTAANMYINGSLKATDTSLGTLRDTADPIWIGRTYINFTGATRKTFNGIIDEVKIYPYARSVEQIKADYISRGSVKGVSSQIGGDNELSSALSNGLVGYWKMDEATWSGTLADVVDSSGNGLTGTAGGATNAKAYPITGKYGNSGYFDGVDDYIAITHNLNQYSEITASAWVNVTWNDSLRNIIFSNSGLGYTASFNLYKNNNNTLVFQLRNNDGGDTVKTITRSVSSLTGWHFVTAVVSTQKKLSNGYYMNMYIDGVSTGNVYVACDTPWNRSASMPNLRIGTTADGYKMLGKIDEARFYNRALSSNEVSALYNFAPGPVAYFDFEEKSGTTTNDKSGNGYTATLTGSPSWIQSQYGTGISTDNSTSDYINTSIVDLPSGDWTAMAWFKYPLSTTAGSWNTLFRGNVVDHQVIVRRSDKQLGVFDNTGNTFVGCGFIVTTLKPGWHHIATVGTGNIQNFYIDGVYKCQSAFKSTSNIRSIGNYHGGSQNWGKFDEVKIYNYARTPGQIVEDMNAGHPIGGSPIASQVGYWKFDEGYGTTVNNSGYGGNNLNGTITSPTWTNEGKFNKALSFNGSSSYVTVTENDALDPGTEDWSYGVWFKTTATGVLPIIYKYNATEYYAIRINNGQIQSYFKVDDIIVSSQTTDSIYNDGKWHHVMASCNRDGNMNLYVDGILKDSDSLSSVSGLNLNNSENLFIGYIAGSYFSGLIDEVKIYNSALTAEQMKLEYNQGKSLVLGSLSDTSQLTGGSSASNSASSIYCVPGGSDPCSPPVAEWNFEEGQGTTVNDTSGNGNTGTWSGTNSHWTNGKYGKGGSFNGNDYVDAGARDSLNLTGNMTIESWVFPNPGTGQQAIIGGSTNVFSHPFGLYIRHVAGGDIGYWVNPDGTRRYTMTGTLNYGQWYHIVTTWDGTTLNLYVNGTLLNNSFTAGSYTRSYGNTWIGRIPDIADPRYFDGKIDQVRIFNYTRTPAQIAWDYSQGKPVGHWKMDECQGTTINDSSGNKNHGTLIIGATGTQTTAGTCSTPSDGTGAWYNGNSGKYNHSMSFDGVDDYVSLGNNSKIMPDTFTVTAWVKVLDTEYNLLWSWNAATPALYVNFPYIPNKALIYMGSANYRYFYQDIDVDDGNWHHVAFMVPGSAQTDINNSKMYVDGVSMRAYSTTSGTVQDAKSTAKIGSGYYFNGQIDDVRIYNYVLTEAQVKNVMNQGAAVRWGPSQSTP